MKKISVLRETSQFRWWGEETIFILTRDYNHKYISRIASSDGNVLIWGCDTYSGYIKVGRTYDNYDFSNSFRKKDFFLIMKDLYPEEFEFFLWHPEVEYGEWNGELGEDNDLRSI